MITSRNDSGDFIIATPTKCATTTLESIAKRHMRNAGDSADQFRIMDWDSPRRQHRMALPPDMVDMDVDDGAEDEWGAADRFLVVRNPFVRYVSVFRYLSAPANYSQWGARRVQGREWPGVGFNQFAKQDRMNFGQFLTWLASWRDLSLNRPAHTEGAAYRSPWVWTDSLLASLDALVSQPGPANGEASLLRMEEMGEWLPALKDEYGLESLDTSMTIHSNRSTWGHSNYAQNDLWGGFRCTERAFAISGEFVGEGGMTCVQEECPAEAIGVWDEAVQLGYV